MKTTAENKVKRLTEKPGATPPAKVEHPAQEAPAPKAPKAKAPKEKPAQAPKAKAPKEKHSMKGLNAFIHEQAALGKSAKEIAQLAHDAKWPQVKLLPGWLNGITIAMEAGAKAAKKKAEREAQKAAPKPSKTPPAKPSKTTKAKKAVES
jgi:hypothetical protein